MKLDTHSKVKLYKQKRFFPTGEDYEHYISEELNKFGYYSYVTKASGDQGADVVIRFNKCFSIVMQCKFYHNAVDNSPVQEVSGALKYYNAQLAIAVTNNQFTQSAQNLAAINNIVLVDHFDYGDDITKIVKALGLYPSKYIDAVELTINDLEYTNQELMKEIQYLVESQNN